LRKARERLRLKQDRETSCIAAPRGDAVLSHPLLPPDKFRLQRNLPAFETALQHQPFRRDVA
jgi:hypothetical protein